MAKTKSPILSFSKFAIITGLFAAFFVLGIFLAIRGGGTIKLFFGITAFSAAGIFVSIFFALELIFLIATLGRGVVKKGVRRSFKEGKPFIPTIFSADLNFIFGTMYVIIAFIQNSYFYIFLAIFYYASMVLRLYIASVIFETNKKRIANVFIVISVGLMILGLFMAGIVHYCIQTNFVFIKSKFLLWVNIITTSVKLVMTFISLFRWVAKKSFLKVLINLIGLSFVIFTCFNIYIGYITYVETFNPTTLAIVNFIFSSIIFLIGTLALIKSILLRKDANNSNELSVV